MINDMTDIEIFDRAVYEYLSDISEHIVYSTTNLAAQNITKQLKHKDKVPYSFISYYRDPNFEIDMDRYNFTAAQLGDMVRLRELEMKKRDAMYVQNIPVNLTYQIDLWSSKERSVQKLAISLISKLYMVNQILIADMNPDGEEARFHITRVDWTDNSDLEVENEKGKLYRHTVRITVDARIKLVRVVETERFKCVPIDIYENSNEGEQE